MIKNISKTDDTKPRRKEVGFFAQMVKAKISATRRNNLVTAPTMITIV